ncbi:MAG: hypothetical protein CBC38_02080 [Gammaproteobacteria bacterium TMED78]|nr:MAG: hypothetical protein CBC38_02080 [Gammaproteobacteria bacterium TMED78]|tara:strand:+ start:1039 stop:1515 length:477 start_codon:yes stop_codon:yes gene_type:complete
MNNSDNIKVFHNPVSFLASCFGVGLSPIAPGTMGSLFGMLFFYLTLDIGYVLQTLIFFTLIFLGSWICGESAKLLNYHDHSSIVWDEMSIMYGVLLFADSSLLDWAILFILFRLFDIWKPWPINYVDKKIGGGIGIMLDDFLAGTAAIIIFQFSRLIF